MKVACIGGGPAGLYFALLLKKSRPSDHVVVHERNRADDTFGWGVVFSDETLGGFEQADPESYARIRERFAYWTDIETWFRGEWVRSTGHGFCGLARKELLLVLQERCRELGVELHFESEVGEDDLPGFDLIVASDGINSSLRERYPDHFQPCLDWRHAKFTWLGTTKPLEAFTFIFIENEHGLFQVHAYPFRRGEEPLSTWIVECHEDVWRAAGLDQASEEDTVAYMQELFAEHLDGHPLLTNRSIWRTFPTVSCGRWTKDNLVLLGDAVHTAHFSIGSGTKLAMEDAIALRDAVVTEANNIPRALQSYEDARRVDTIKTQKAAQTSLEWFENSARYRQQDPLLFTFNLMTRSKRITYDNLAERDPDLVERVRERWAELQGMPAGPDGKHAPPLFAPLELRSLRLPNRMVVSPMCQYSAQDGTPNDWHLVHLGSRALGGAGLVIAEMTNVTAQGRITHGCTGIWNDEHTAAWSRITSFVHAQSSAKIGLQLGHAGRKASCALPWDGDRPLTDASAWPAIGPSADPFGPGWPTPQAMDEAEMAATLEAYVAATRRALEAGFDLIEVHMAHGYLLSSFLSPLSNRRRDAFGGSLENRMRFPLQVLEAVRAEWPQDRPISVRISATDWLDDQGGQTLAESVELSKRLGEAGCDLIDVSSAGNSPVSKPIYGRMYQVPFAERIRYETGLPVLAVGAIQGADHANTILAAGRADLCALARPHLIDPHLTLRASIEYDVPEHEWPRQYWPARPRSQRGQRGS